MTPQRARLDVRALLAALVVAGLVALVAYAAGSGSPITSTRLPLVHVSESATSVTPTATPGGDAPSMSDFWAMVILAGIALIVAVPVVYVLVRLVLLLRGITNRYDVMRSGWDEEDVRLAAGAALPDADRTDRLVAGVDAGLTALESGRDAREAVIECWVRLERAAGDVGVRRRPEETATNLALRVLADARVGRSQLDRLLGLYHEARYSPHPITSADADAARSALAEVRHDLAAKGSVAMRGDGG